MNAHGQEARCISTCVAEGQRQMQAFGRQLDRSQPSTNKLPTRWKQACDKLEASFTRPLQKPQRAFRPNTRGRRRSQKEASTKSQSERREPSKAMRPANKRVTPLHGALSSTYYAPPTLFVRPANKRLAPLYGTLSSACHAPPTLTHTREAMIMWSSNNLGATRRYTSRLHAR